MRFLSTLFIMLTVSTTSWANIGPQGFYAHPNKYFVETGTYGGAGVQKALDAGFQIIHSLDIEGHFVEEAKRRFFHCPQVHIWHKDSGKQLCEVINTIDEPITFWLDGHNGWPSTDGSKNTPLIEELDQIKQHKIKTHTIMIDDLHCCDTILFDFLSLDNIIQKVLEINPNYTISFEPGGDQGEYPTNVLVATIVE